MAQSVKLKDGSYIDTEGIYDVTQKKTQNSLNGNIPDTKIVWDDHVVADIDNADYAMFKVHSGYCTAGTWPNLGATVLLVIQEMDNSASTYNAQLAFGFASDKIAFRRKKASTTWEAWKYITFS